MQLERWTYFAAGGQSYQGTDKSHFSQETLGFLQDLGARKRNNGMQEEGTIMKSMTKRFTQSLGSVLVFWGALLPGSARTDGAQLEQQFLASHAADKIEIEGTWLVTVTQNVCETGAPIGPPFQALLTFARGGTLSGTTASTAFQPGQRSGDFGVWTQTGEHNYNALDEAFILFGAGAFTQGRQTIKHSISFTRGGFTDAASVQFYDLNGLPLLKTPGCATAVGQRVQ
jgi:hypothetical protein